MAKEIVTISINELLNKLQLTETEAIEVFGRKLAADGTPDVSGAIKKGYSNRFPVLETKPAQYAEDSYFTYEGQLWRGRGFAEEGEPDIAVIPAKGYWEYSAFISYIGGTEFQFYEEKQNDGLPAPTVSGTRDSFALNFDSFWLLQKNASVISANYIDSAEEIPLTGSSSPATNGVINVLTSGSVESVEYELTIKVFP